MTKPRLIVMLCVAAFSSAWLFWTPTLSAEVEVEVDLIREAVPDKAPANPRKLRTMLVFTKTAGYRHSSIPTGVAAMRILGKKTGAFTIKHSEDPAVFAPDNLNRFDAICFLNTTGTLFTEESLRKSLITFVKGGRGVVGIHAATDTFYDWPEYGRMMGGYFDGHPWHEQVTLKIEDPDHVCNRCFTDSSFEVTDEIYQFKEQPYSRKRLRILTSLDTTKTNMTRDGIKRRDGDFAVSWLNRFGKGRVFYCSLGHREEVYWNPTVLAHYLAGIQFALGDLPADAKPSDSR